MAAAPAPGADRPRIIVSTDIGGTDFDDFQSMVHLLVYADRFEIEGLVSSPYGPGRKEHILQVIDHYERDYPNLKTHSAAYPTPARLREVTKQGALDSAGLRGYGASTEGSDWIIRCAKRDDPRPLWVLVWGGIDDLAQALHDDPTIKKKIRAFFIGGPNKKWSATAYDAIARDHPDTWMIEANSSYYGWFVGGNQTGDLANDAFVARHIAGRGALGTFFAGLNFEGKARATLKMGDTPSLMYLLGANPDDPTKDSWGGRFVRAWERPRRVFDHAQNTPPTTNEIVETSAIVDCIYRLDAPLPVGTKAALVLDKQEFPGFPDETGAWHFVFSPKHARTWSYAIKSSHPALDGRTGGFTSVLPSPDLASKPSPRHPSWWTDDPDPALIERGNLGAKTINRWREDYLRDFAARMRRCEAPAAKP